MMPSISLIPIEGMTEVHELLFTIFADRLEQLSAVIELPFPIQLMQSTRFEVVVDWNRDQRARFAMRSDDA